MVILATIGTFQVPTTPVSAQESGGYYATVAAAANAYGLDPDYMWRIVGCETAGTYALDIWGKHGEYGPFQFMEGTFYSFATMSGLGGSWQDPYAQAWVAAWAFSRGYGPQHWSCYWLV